MSSGISDYQHWYCQWHLKNTYPTKKKAKLAMRQLHPGNRMSVYPCDYYTEGWHIGHLPKGVVFGVYDRAELRGK